MTLQQIFSSAAAPDAPPPEAVRAAFDWLAVGLVIGVFATILPPIAAVLTIVYHLVRIWETETVRGWRRRVRAWWCRRA